MDPQFGIRMVGHKTGVVVPVRLVQQSSQLWSGQFHLSLDGNYRVDAHWWGCGGMLETTSTSTKDGQPKQGTAATVAPIEFQVTGPWTFVTPTIVSANQHNPPSIGEGAEFPSSAVWMSMMSSMPSSFVKPSATIPHTETDLTLDASHSTEYIWTDPTRFTLPSSDPTKDDWMVLNDAGSEPQQIETIVSRYGTLTAEHQTYLLNHVGNYEIVCFFGNPDLHRLFLKELKLGSVVKGVRPFKFHYYSVTNLQHPDHDWGPSGRGDKRATCRKCKHIFLSVDDLENTLSQEEFRNQYITFVRHLQKLMDDPTFPIWLLTSNAPATTNQNCHAPYVVPRTTDHPCNDVIRTLVQKGDVFEDRVLLMDNTDLSLLPYSLRSSNDDDDSIQPLRRHMEATIALRIFVLIGKGVADWRARGQQAWSDGLYRNGTLVVPTQNLDPYNWNATV